jgi:hypothetical protein
LARNLTKWNHTAIHPNTVTSIAMFFVGWYAANLLGGWSLTAIHPANWSTTAMQLASWNHTDSILPLYPELYPESDPRSCIFESRGHLIHQMAGMAIPLLSMLVMRFIGNGELLQVWWFLQALQDQQRQKEMLRILTCWPAKEQFLRIREFCLAWGVETGPVIDEEYWVYLEDRSPEIAQRIRQEELQHHIRLEQIREEGLQLKIEKIREEGTRRKEEREKASTKTKTT